MLTNVDESTCLGVAFAAGLACGIYQNVAEIKSLIPPNKEILFASAFEKEAEK